MTSQPIGLLDIVQLSGEFLVLATLLGNPIRRLLLQVSTPGWEFPAEIKWIFSVGSGVAVLALLLLWIGLFPGTITFPTAAIVMFVTVGSNLFIYRRELKNLHHLVFKPFPTYRSLRGRWFLAVFLIIFAVQMSSLVGIWVTPGDDAKLYSLIAARIIQSQALPRDWGIFANSNWYSEHVHLLLPGFSSEIAFLNLLLGAPIPGGVSVLASLFRCLAPASIYSLTMVLTRRRFASLAAMIVYGLVIVEPTFGWFTWGGMAELSAIAVLPIACAGTYLLARAERFSWKTVLWTGILLAGMSMLHPFAFFYYLAFLIGVSATLFLRKRITRGLAVWTPALLSLVIAVGPLINALLPEISISKSYSTGNPAWTPTLSWTQPISQAIGSVEFRFLAVYGFAATLLLLVGLGVSRHMLKPQRRILSVLGLWYAILFLLHENNPNGLFVIPFPLWYRIDANRTFGITSLVVSVLIGLVASYWAHRALPPLHSFREVVTRSRTLIGKNWKTALVVALVLLMLSVQEASNINVLIAARSNSPITSQDIAAFGWIQQQTPANATFFTNTSDAGTWIPLYANRKVVMPFGVVTNNTLLAEYETAVDAFSKNPSNSTALRFMNLTGATYVYAGPGRIYGREGFDPTKINATTLFDVVYHQEEVWIFQLK